LIYRSCPDGKCDVRLLRPDGVEYSLAEINPRAARQIGEHGFEGAALSHDATQLGIRTGAGYEIYRIGEDDPIYTADAGPEGSQWEVSTWGVGTSTLCMVQMTEARATAFTQFWDGVPHTYTADNLELVPIPGACGALAEQIDMSLRPSNRERITDLVVDSALVIVEDTDLGEQGTLHVPGGGKDLSALMNENETLAGPRGVPEEMWHPGPMSSAVDDDIPRHGVKVFAPSDDELIVTAVLVLGYADVPGEPLYSRMDMPVSTSEDRWELLALMRDGVALAHMSEDTDRTELLLLAPDSGEPTLIHELPADAEILLPGAVLAQR
jgi:hypothetical protein